MKDRKNPSDGDIQALEDIMGTDHHSFDSKLFEDVGGGAAAPVAQNRFAEKSHAMQQYPFGSGASAGSPSTSNSAKTEGG